jgi:mRNA interferase MazF
VVRGDVREIKLPRGRGRIQHGRRYAVVVQADDLMALSTVVICPTSRSTPAATFHPEILVDGNATRVLCEMIGAVDARRLGNHVCHLSLGEVAAVDEALGLVLELAG